MSQALPLHVVLAVEGPSDERRMRLLLQQPPFPPLVDRQVDVEILTIKSVPETARKLGLRTMYTPDGANKGDGGTLRRVYQVLRAQRRLRPGTLLVWVRDSDGREERRQEAEAGRRSLPTASVSILLAIASECGEAWVIAGYQPSPETKGLHSSLKRRLGFDPWRHPERLSHKTGVPKDAKRVLSELFDGDQDLEDEALLRAWAMTGEVPERCGLTAFREEASTWADGLAAANT